MSVNVSVIIPVYNAENYISQCIESLLNQTLQECEFIFINDGSKDKSREIIENYQKSNNRIKLLNQKNQGVSSARNTGLQVAAGEYIAFVDADDYIEKEMYEILYNSAKQNDCDLVVSNFESEMGEHKIITKYPFPINTDLKKDFIQKELLPYFLKTDNLNSVVNKLYKKQLIKEYNVKFPVGVSLGEDGMFNIKFLSYANSIKYLDYTGYHYREVSGSATRNISEKDYFNRALEVYKLEVPEIYSVFNDKVKVRRLKSIKLINNVMSYIHVYFTPSKDVKFSQRYNYIKKMIRNKYVREALPLYCSETYRNLGRYEKFIIDMIKRKSTMGLFFATTYSRFRNK